MLRATLRPSGGVHDVATPRVQALSLERLLAELHGRAEKSGNSCRDFCLSAVQQIEAIRSCANRTLRLKCTEELFRHFYGSGDLATSLRVSRIFSRLAAASGDKSWLRKAYGFEGIARADAGDVHGAVLSHSSGLQLDLCQGHFRSDGFEVRSALVRSLLKEHVELRAYLERGLPNPRLVRSMRRLEEILAAAS
jgi:hypothetical protein